MDETSSAHQDGRRCDFVVQRHEVAHRECRCPISAIVAPQQPQLLDTTKVVR